MCEPSWLSVKAATCHLKKTKIFVGPSKLAQQDFNIMQVD